MKQFGTINEAYGIDKTGLNNLEAVHWNYRYPKLVEEALARGEGRLIHGGALAVNTGVHTGRSPKDKHTVRDETTENTIWWDSNKSMTPEAFDLLHADMLKAAEGKELFVQDLYGGADPENRIKARIVTELAWQSHFIRNMLIRPEHEDLASFIPELTLIDLPSFETDPEKYGVRSGTCIAINFAKKIILVAGSLYGGEIKKAVFTTLNYLLPEKGIMPMHCSANVGDDDDSAIFFGLSGTGKTTLSADPNRTLLGDDEHGWGPNGLFNFEGGCYAKTIKLSEEAEPEIFATTHRFGAIVENMIIDPITDKPDFMDSSITENTRVSYPIDFIPNASLDGTAPHPKNIIMLTADAFGVLPPIAKLTAEQAMYHFLSGYTAKVAGTEKGVTEPEATFSTCFGAPFMPRHPSEYGNLLRDMMNKHDVTCWLVNTGWTGGAYGVGSRMPIKATRALLTAALDGSLADAEFRTDEVFGVAVPVECPGVETSLLTPRDTWEDKAAFDAMAAKLAGMFVKNFEYYLPHVDEGVKVAGPKG